MWGDMWGDTWGDTWGDAWGDALSMAQLQGGEAQLQVEAALCGGDIIVVTSSRW